MTWCFEASLQFPKGRLNFVEKWPVMNPADAIFILMTYLAFVWRVGPLLMENQRPMRAKWPLTVYRVFKVTASGLLAYQFLLYIIDKGLFPRKCEHDELTAYIQFVLEIIYMTVLYYSSECPMTTASYSIGLGYLSLFTYQLTDFYNWYKDLMMKKTPPVPVKQD